MDRTALHADLLALELSQVIAHHSTLLHHQTSRSVVVLVGEVDRFFAVFGNRHGRENGVDLAHFQCRDQAVELLLDPNALDLHFFAQGIADVVVETDDAAIRRLRRERRVGCFDTDFQRFFIGNRCQRQHGQRQGAKKREFLHLRTPSVKGESTQ
ncbi:hypothetical protein D9M71_618410 [compost metagenome]